MRTPTRSLQILLVLLTLATAPLTPGRAHAATDPGATQIESFDAALLDTMKNGASLGPKGRFRKLSPVMEKVFDFPAMTRFAVGPAWSTFSPAQQQQVIDAFAKMSVANFAHNFSSYGGERFEIDPNIQNRGPDKVVSTHMVRPNDSPVALTYRMRQSGDAWKVIDVYFGAISQLTTRRSDFAGPVASGGAAGLVTHLNSLTEGLMK